jgi:hypothetical protein
MSDIITERSGHILQIQLNRPEKKNAMTLAMYITLADLLNDAAKDDQIRVVRWNLRTRKSPFASVRPKPRKHSTHFSQRPAEFRQNERDGESKSTSRLTYSEMSIFENLRKG